MNPKELPRLAYSFLATTFDIKNVACLAAGALLPLAFAPLQWFPLAILSPAFLFFCWLNAEPRRAAVQGFLFGLGMFGVGVSWVYVSLHNFGNMPWPLAGTAVLLFVAVLALYPALLGYAQARYFGAAPAAWRLMLVMPGLWVLFEWWRGWFLSGFPWLNLGYSHSDTALAGLAPVLGIYGMSLAVAITAGALAALCVMHARKGKIICATAIVLLWLGASFVGKIEWVVPAGKPLKAALIQGNIPLQDKWQPLKQRAILTHYLRLSVPHQDALIIWPEAAVPADIQSLEPWFLNALKALSTDNRNEFLIGSIERASANGADNYYNSIIRFPGETVYRKQHLVPFGEFIPLQPLFNLLLRTLNIPMSDLRAGKGQNRVMPVADTYAGLSICYEDVFGAELAHALPQAAILINVSEDAWFGHSFGPYQRMQMARMRTLELGRPMLRVGNGGFSAIIDHRGNILKKSMNFKTDVVTAHAQPMQGLTPYARWTDVPALLSALLIVGMSWRRKKPILFRA